MLSHPAHGVHLCWAIGRNAPAVAAHAALQIDTVIGLADATDAWGDLRSLGADAMELLARRLRFLGALLQAWGGLGFLG